MRLHTRIRLIGLPHAHVDTRVVVSEGEREVFAFFLITAVFLHAARLFVVSVYIKARC